VRGLAWRPPAAAALYFKLGAPDPPPPLPLPPPSLHSEAPERSVTWRLLICAFVGSVCAAQYGWAIGIINFPAAVMCSDFALSGTDSWWWSGGVVAGFCVAGFLGSHFGGGLADAMGRRRLVVALNVPFVAAGLLGYGASVLKGQGGLWLMLASRLVVGAAAGAGSVVTPLYLGEIATEATRGAFGALFQLQITVFILLVQLASMPGALSSSSTWGYLFAASAALSLAGLLAAPLLIESPKWLLKQGRQDHAQSALALLRGVSQAEALEDLQHLESQEEGGGGEDVEARLVGGAPAQPRVLSLGQVLADPYLRFPLLILSVLMVTQQFSGINAVFYYSAGFFKVS
jgi:MFS family permease